MRGAPVAVWNDRLWPSTSPRKFKDTLTADGDSTRRTNEHVAEENRVLTDRMARNYMTLWVDVHRVADLGSVNDANPGDLQRPEVRPSHEEGRRRMSDSSEARLDRLERLFGSGSRCPSSTIPSRPSNERNRRPRALRLPPSGAEGTRPSRRAHELTDDRERN